VDEELVTANELVMLEVTAEAVTEEAEEETDHPPWLCHCHPCLEEMMLEEAVCVMVLRYVEQVVTVMTVGSAEDADDVLSKIVVADVLESPESLADEVVEAELELLLLEGPQGAGTGPTTRRWATS
jgi:hypothetical protein